MNGIDRKNKTAGDGEVPEKHWYHTSFLPLRMNPLDNKAHKKKELTEQSKERPESQPLCYRFHVTP